MSEKTDICNNKVDIKEQIETFLVGTLLIIIKFLNPELFFIVD